MKTLAIALCAALCALSGCHSSGSHDPLPLEYYEQ